MKIIEPSVELLRTGLEKEFVTPEQFIEKVGRTCYKSEDKITEDSAAKFVSNLIKRGHEAILEHWNLVFNAKDCAQDIVADCEYLTTNCGYRCYLRFTRDELLTRDIVSGNMRAWRDYAKTLIKEFGYIPRYMYGMIRNYPLFFPEYQDYVPPIFSYTILTPIKISELTPYERKVHQNVTLKFICDRGVSHEIVRHRPASYAQESTRYCNYSLDKFGREITVVRPSWCEEDTEGYSYWRASCDSAENDYFDLLDIGATAQQARSVLPNSLKTELVMTASLDEWEHFFKLRCAPDAHPDMQEVAKLAKDVLYREAY